VLERLRADPRTVDIPVLILSADATRTHVDLLLRAGAQAYLTKPFAVVDLLTLVDRHLGRPGSAPAEEP
jgi:CheY-like chemotaxis protein